jgi:hypothetical protein
MRLRINPLEAFHQSEDAFASRHVVLMAINATNMLPIRPSFRLRLVSRNC